MHQTMQGSVLSRSRCLAAMRDEDDGIAATAAPMHPWVSGDGTDSKQSMTVARLACRMDGAAPPALRVKLLDCLVRPLGALGTLGTLGMAGVAAGAFGCWRRPSRAVQRADIRQCHDESARRTGARTGSPEYGGAGHRGTRRAQGFVATNPSRAERPACWLPSFSSASYSTSSTVLRRSNESRIRSAV